MKQLRNNKDFIVTLDMFNELPEGAIPCQENPDPVISSSSLGKN